LAARRPDSVELGLNKKISLEMAVVASSTIVAAILMSRFECRFRTPSTTSRISGFPREKGAMVPS
jgi:hypothetical protein